MSTREEVKCLLRGIIKSTRLFFHDGCDKARSNAPLAARDVRR